MTGLQSKALSSMSSDLYLPLKECQTHESDLSQPSAQNLSKALKPAGFLPVHRQPVYEVVLISSTDDCVGTSASVFALYRM